MNAAEIMFLNGTDPRGGYFLVPDLLPTDPDNKAWVVVDVHGAGGLKPDRDSTWLMELFHPVPVIVLVPSFSDGYQSGDGKWAGQLLSNFREIQSKYPVQGKMFLHGHSGGAQFVHRFAFHRPDMVSGVSAHSAGSWACDGGLGSINPEAKGIPFLISCGEEDTKYSLPRYPYTRIEWYKRFAAALEEQGFVVNSNIWPNTGHGVSPDLYKDSLMECFLLATQGKVPKGPGWRGITISDNRSDARESSRYQNRLRSRPGNNAICE